MKRIETLRQAIQRRVHPSIIRVAKYSHTWLEFAAYLLMARETGMIVLAVVHVSLVVIGIVLVATGVEVE